MKPSILYILATAAIPIAAVPSNDRDLVLNKAPLDALDAVSEYFNLLAHKIQTYKSLDSAPGCNPSHATLPSSDLPEVSTNLSLIHIAIGRGTQNYTCDTPDSSSVPKAAGAVAALFNTTCPSTLYPDFNTILPKVAVHFALDDWTALDQHHLGPTGLKSSGLHYFQALNSTANAPFFSLEHIGLGSAQFSVNSSVPAPSTAAKGQAGEKAVAWLKLITRDALKASFSEIYRVNTVGGSPPSTCEGLAPKFTIEYSAEYWFYGRTSPPVEI
ncbi:hypothetical protein HOO65_040547 [Ceratocystis lukuohia]|uniref:Malate dehydrogenase n=2 Tax=Ceratocystis TaxID=5157 RepID=A0A0F8BS60_CERFI|nr:hypothetical protein CFO_g2235 [Ceratocystis platani]